jgi:hypothetical protein
MKIKKYQISYLLIFLALFGLIILGPASTESSYKITDIGTLTGGEI